MATLRIEDPAATGGYAGPAWLALGFRPFYLLAAIFAATSVPLWLGTLQGWLRAPHIDLNWHMHEMLFGFVMAVVIGFLYTAGRNWTGLWTPRGAGLAAIAGLWIAGRVAMLAGATPLAAAIDLAFIPVAAWPLYRVLARSGNRRNMVMLVMLALLMLANAAFHAIRQGWLAASPMQPLHAAIIVIVVIEAIIGGRIIPNFTANAIAGVKPVPNITLDKNCMILTAFAGVAWALQLPAAAAAPFALGAAVAQAWRLSLWKPWCTLRHPLLWIMHLSYAWIPAGFVLLALAECGVVPMSAAVHVLALGALAGLIVGMITRTALGHTGRPLKAERVDTAMYVLIQLGTVARVAAALVPGSLYMPLLLVAGACWCATFVVYVAVYGPRLCQPRLDGREG
ncbi:MAG: NnrS family protein [Gammaproteobacteria bacterium]